MTVVPGRHKAKTVLLSFLKLRHDELTQSHADTPLA